jgi:beta-galactosidase
MFIFSRLVRALHVLLFCAVLTGTLGAAESETVDFDQGWRFTRGDTPAAQFPSFDDSRWSLVDLPHDWSIEGPYDRNNPAYSRGAWLPAGIGYYRKTFSLPAGAADKKVFIYFGGIYRNSDVWLNGQFVGRRPSGYTSFFYDLTPHLRETNVLTVKVDNSSQPGSRWYSGSGIYRSVQLLIRDKLFIPIWATAVRTPVAAADRAELTVTSTVRNERATEQDLVFESCILDANGQKIAEARETVAVGAGTSRYVTLGLAVDRPNRWGPDSPYLYTVRNTLRQDKTVLQVEEIKTGIRRMQFDAEVGFTLNEENVKVKGVCLHHDGGPLGAAVYPRTLERQLLLMKKMGANAIRTAHNPMSDEFMNLCDRLGMLVLDEAFDEWQVPKAAPDVEEDGTRITHLMDYYANDFDEWFERDLAEFVQRDRNHPCVFMWSLGNEIAQTQDKSGIAIAKKMQAIVRRYDDRPTTIACNGYPGLKNPSYDAVIDAADVQGFNYAKSEQLAHEHQRWPQRKMIVTECVSAQPKIERGMYDLRPDPVGARDEDGSISTASKGLPKYLAFEIGSAAWQAVLQNPHVMGMFIWTGTDHLGEVNPHPWPARAAFCGPVDLCGFPKDGFYFYQSQWTERPMLHVFPHWNWEGKEGMTIPVGCITNCATVELSLNGKSLGRKAANPTGVTVFEVPYAKGQLKAVGYSPVGKRMAETIVATAGPAAKLKLSGRSPVLKADGKDLYYVECTITDAAGRMVPNADSIVKFQLEGPASIRGVENGDQMSHEAMKANQRSAFHGKCLAIIKSGTSPGLVTFSAYADGLETATLQLAVQ